MKHEELRQAQDYIFAISPLIAIFIYSGACLFARRKKVKKIKKRLEENGAKLLPSKEFSMEREVANGAIINSTMSLRDILFFLFLLIKPQSAFSP